MIKQYPSLANNYLIAFFFFCSLFSFGQTTQLPFNSSGSFTVPAGVTSITVEAWGGGGSSGSNSRSSGGGGGGAYTRGTITVTPGQILAVTVGLGGVFSTTDSTTDDGGPSSVGVIVANGGSRGGVNTPSGGVGGTLSINPGGISGFSSYSGGNGGNGTSGNGGGGGGGGASASASGPGGDGVNGGNNGSGGTGGLGGISLGPIGGNGGRGANNTISSLNSQDGIAPGGGGGGKADSRGNNRNGGSGRVILSWLCPSYSLTSVAAVSTACTSNKTSLVTLNATAASLPIGSYTVTYSLSINSNVTSYTAPMTVTTAGTGQFTADLGIMGANNATTIRIDALASGLCNTTLITNNISNTVDMYQPITLTLGTITQPTCAVPTGSVILLGLPSTGPLTITPFPGTPGITVTRSGATATISGLAQGTSYTFTVSGGSCSPVVIANVPITSLETTTYNGTTWSSGFGINKIGTITAVNASPISLTTDTELCSCTISANTNLEVKPGVTLKLENQLIVNASGSITFENGSSLVQVNDAAVNSGVIDYKRQTTVVRRASDYTYWSSPVAAQNLLALSPNTNPARFWSFTPGATWFVEPSPSTKIMEIGKGYIIRAPETNYPAYPALSSVFEATFTGAPNNGEKTIAVGGPNTFNLIGNPYPSAIDAVKFLNVNSSVLGGTIYFWTHNTAIRNKVGAGNEGSGDLVFIQDDYASFNRTGGVGTAPAISEPAPKRIPNGFIAAGQSFFTTSTATAGTLVTFNNDMRIGASYLNNSQFFRTKASEKNNVATDRSRIWLNLTNKQNAFKQTLVGYIDGATNDFDSAFDGLSFNANAIINFYSVNNAANYVIQGRALPFEQNDLVPLGYSSTVEGEFAISIDNLDGLFTTQNVFLEDKNTNTIHNLKTSPYSFQTTIGTFNDRFVLRYTDKTLGVEDVIADGNKVFVTVKNKQLKVNAGKEDIKSVVIYSILGKQIYFKKDITSKELVIDNLPSSDQVLIVKTVLEDGTLHTTKTIFK